MLVKLARKSQNLFSDCLAGSRYEIQDGGGATELRVVSRIEFRGRNERPP